MVRRIIDVAGKLVVGLLIVFALLFVRFGMASSGDTPLKSFAVFVAKTLHQPTLCDVIIGPGFMYSSAPRCKIEVAVLSGDPTLCSSVDIVSVPTCFKEYFETNGGGDASKCTIIEAGETQDECLVAQNRFLKDPNICLRIRGTSLRGSCLSSLALDTKDPDVCAKYIPEDYSVNRSNCYYSVAVALGDIKYCELITISDTKRYCISAVIRNTKK